MKRLILAALLCAAPATAQAQQKLTVLLDWFVNPDHAPLIVAEQRGDFRRFGLDVRLVAPADPNDPPKLVAARQGDVAVYYQKSLHLAVDQGLPLVRIGTLIATPLSTVTVLQDGPIRDIADFKGRRIGYSVAGFEEIVMAAMLQGSGVGVGELRFVAVNFGLSTALMSGQVDAIIGGFRNFELNQLAIENRPGRAFFPEEHGVPLYDELIYVAHRDRVGDPRLRAFIDATEAATAYLINNPDAALRMFLEGRKELDNELNHRAWSATLPRFAHSPAALDRNRYDRFARWLAERKLIRSVPAVETYAVELAPAAR
ncbi:MAG: ABC transporter substrate-binding protein [Acetobacteraceae bacterium]|nr:ABC transporter substrate-binding protein [Acetobacteraceae bacterium]